MDTTASENMFMLQCDQIVNDTWAKAALHFNEIKRIVEAGEITNEHDEAILLIAANATLQKMTFDNKKEAMQREKQLKSAKGRKFIWEIIA